MHHIKQHCFYTLIICLASSASILFALDDHNHTDHDHSGHCHSGHDHSGHDHGDHSYKKQGHKDYRGYTRGSSTKQNRTKYRNSNYSPDTRYQTRHKFGTKSHEANHPEGCTDCQSHSHSKSNNRRQPVSYQKSFSMQPAQNVSAFQIEQSAQFLLKELRSTSQQKSYPDDLHSDVSKILNYSQNLSTAEKNGDSAKELYEIAKTIALPLKRIDRYFSFSKQESRVRTANRDIINMLIAYAKQTRKPVNNRPKQSPRRSYQTDVAPIPNLNTNSRDDVLTIPNNRFHTSPGNNRDNDVLTIPDNAGFGE